jgi:O-antigen ligase
VYLAQQKYDKPLMKKGRDHLLFYSIIAMMACLFLSRAALSVSIIVFVALSFMHAGIKGQLKSFFSSPLLWGMSLLFLLPLLSGWWSGDKTEWLHITRIKLPLLLLPLAFAGPFNFSKTQWHILGYVFIGLVTAGTIWSMFHYVTDMSAVNEGYLRAKTIITPLANDHVRFSWLVAVTIVFAGWLWWRYRYETSVSIIPGVILLWLIVFLHILAVRTGLLCFYIALLATILWTVFGKTKPVYATALFMLMAGLPVAAYLTLPTFRNKVKYFQYDFEFVKDAHYLPGGNDASRIISIKAGWNMVQQHPVSGVGFGDIFNEAGKWYDTAYPQMLEADKILPSNEWLIYGTGCGIPGLLVFTFVMIVPFLIRVRNKQRWWLLNVIVATGFLFDIGLEVQYGVFIYSFIVLICWKWFHDETLKA